MRRPLLFLLSMIAACAAWPTASVAAEWQGTIDATYQAAQPGDTVVVPAPVVSLGNSVIGYRAAVANLPGGCAVGATAKCIRIVVDHPVTINGALEVRGSSVWIDGGATRNLRVTGYVDTEADSAAQHPDHVIVEGTRSTAFGVFNVDTATFRNMDVGPQTLGSGCAAVQGRGMENKIGFGGGITYVPRDVTIDGVTIHNQNVNAAGRASQCHFGGLFLVTVDGLTIRNSIFERNVVYNIQIQNFNGAPPAKRVLIEHNSFGCPVEWLDEKGENTCDGQRSIQFDYPVGAEFTLKDNLSANGPGGLYGCTVGDCGGTDAQNRPMSVRARETGTIDFPTSPVAPPLSVTPPPTPACSDGIDNDGDGKIDYPADPGCSSPSDTDETDTAPVCPGANGGLTLTRLSETATTVTFGWTPVSGSIGYRFTSSATPGRYSHTWDATRSSVKFAKGSACYFVGAILAGPTGGISASERSRT